MARLNTQAARHWQFRFYFAGLTPRAALALQSIREHLTAALVERYAIELIDLNLAPARAAKDQIVALPCLVRSRPEPTRRAVGSFVDKSRLAGLLELAT